MVSFRHVGVYNWLDPLLGLGLVVFALARSQRPLGLTALLAFSLLSLAGLAVVYAISLMVQSLAIWAIGSEGLDDLIQGMVEAGRFPVQMYRGVVRALLTFVIPVAVLTTFPAQALVGEVAVPVIVNVTLVAVALLWISARIWRLALRHYSGASA